MRQLGQESVPRSKSESTVAAKRGSGLARTPGLAMQLQRTIGNAAVCGLLGREASHAPRVTPVRSSGTAVVQRLVGRADGAHDMDAEMVKNWLTSAGVWQGVKGPELDMLEAMMQSDYQWSYGGAYAVELVRDARAFLGAGVRPDTVRNILDDVPYRRGLVKGGLVRARNEADFHVDPGDGKGLIADMLAVCEDVYEKMTATSMLPGRPDGVVYMRPQGAAVIKIVTQLLGEALGNRGLIEMAHERIKSRKTAEWWADRNPFSKRPPMSKEVLDKSVVPEHTSYIASLVGTEGLNIQPLLPQPASTEAEFTQNMLEQSVPGRQRLDKYLKTVETAKDAVSMNIYVARPQLPAVIRVLRGGT